MTTSPPPNDATIKAAKIGGAAVLVAAIIGGGFMLFKDDGGAKSAGDTKADNACGTTVGGQGNARDTTIVCGGSSKEPDHEASGSKAPQGNSPWPYLVYKTVVGSNDEGLFVRSCPEENGCHRTGHVFKSTVLYAVCQKKNVGFRAGWPEADDTWLKIKWPTDKEWKEGDPRPSSSASDTKSGWVLSYFTTPRDHNGNIPECQE
ncbi:hypothetical protein ACFWNR_06950 [Streptomyces virginiae]|uniref:hypothetical protein n=1 Tax=Streptomyces virginiae TaxID=1961 RepID=UPI00365AEF2F